MVVQTLPESDAFQFVFGIILPLVRTETARGIN